MSFRFGGKILADYNGILHTRKASFQIASRLPSGATAALCNRFIPPEIPKTSPMPPPLSESETNFRFLSGGDMGEVLGE